MEWLSQVQSIPFRISFLNFYFIPFLSTMASITSNTVFADLIQSHPSWTGLSGFLRSSEGGSLTIQDYEGDLSVIRYVKGHSNMSLSHVRAFRSVVWNTAENRPVSVTAFKSEDGEAVDPTILQQSNIRIEEFVDGVMIGQFWDGANWRIHTRSTLDAGSRYFSKRSFADLFEDAKQSTFGSADLESLLDRTVSYTWVLQHPENRIVCPVQKPRLTLVAMIRVEADSTVSNLALSTAPAGVPVPKEYMNRSEDSANASPADALGVMTLLIMMKGNLNHQGIVVKTAGEPFRRWKVRSEMYKTVRHLRGNTARRDFLWMDLWSKGLLSSYMAHYPEERLESNNLINRWKSVTADTYKFYVDGFKARTLDRKDIPAKFRPLVYGLHNHYLTVMKPSHKALDWREAVKFMNERDTAQKIFVLNWDLRKENQENQNTIPLEPLPTSAKPSAEPTAAESQPITAAETNAVKEEGEI
jgi:hypothetical protein